MIYVTSIYGAGEENEDKINSTIITDLIYKKQKCYLHQKLSRNYKKFLRINSKRGFNFEYGSW